MRSIKKVAGPIASVPMEWELRGEDVELPELEAFWAEPAEGLGWSDFVEASVGWLKLAGEFFWVMDDTWLAPLRNSFASRFSRVNFFIIKPGTPSLLSPMNRLPAGPVTSKR
jgi:hypothetical protein